MTDPRDKATSVLSNPLSHRGAWLRPQGILPPKAFLKSSRAGLEIQPPKGMMMITIHSFQEICPLGLSRGQVASGLTMSHILTLRFPKFGEAESTPPTCSPYPHLHLLGEPLTRRRRDTVNAVLGSRTLKQDQCHSPPLLGHDPGRS